MPNEVTGRLVTVESKFLREAVKPGGVSRAGARVASEKSMAEVKAQVERQIDEMTALLVALLRGWPDGSADDGCLWSATVRDLAGLANMHLLTEVAMHTFDCLDAVLVDGAKMERAEAVCYADALVFARQDLCRGSDIEPYRPLLRDLEKLTTLVIGRGKAVA